MGTNTQAMRSASSSAEEAAEGGVVPGRFPFTVISGGAEVADAPVNAAFAAYAKRSVAPARTAREALVSALAELEAREGGAAREGADGGGRVDEASYGVTRSPFARVSAPVAAPVAAAPAVVAPMVEKTEPAPAAEVAKAAQKRRPALRADVAVSSPHAVDAASSAEAMEAPLRGTAPAPEASEPVAETSAGKLKISLRRGASPVAAPPPVEPTSDDAFLFGPAMDVTRSPLIPLPVATGSAGGELVSPTQVVTRAPFPVAGGAAAVSAGAGLVPLYGAQVVRPGEDRKGAERAPTSEASEAWGGRPVVLVVCVALIALAGYFWKLSPYWPFEMKPVAVAGEAEVRGEAPRALSADGGHESVASAPALPDSTPPNSTVAASTPPARPAPGPAFKGVLESLKITGVLQGEPVRAIIDGRLVQAGDLVEVARGVRLVGLDVAGRQLIFEDLTTARASVRY